MRHVLLDVDSSAMETQSKNFPQGMGLSEVGFIVIMWVY